MNLKLALALLVIAWAFAAEAREPNPLFATWAAIKTPSQSIPPKILGSYSAGCISGATALPLDGKGYLVLRPFRNRYYGHPSLVNYLKDLGSRAKDRGMPTVMFGDMSAPRGGPFLRGHSSHQTGLDVDISLSFATRTLTTAERNAWVDPSFVIERKRVNSEWSRNHDLLIELAAQASNVARIFVAPGIKKHLCDTSPSAPWLYKIRSWWGHDDHIHVRLNCPADSPNCENQPALSSQDNGCGSELSDWMTPEKDRQAAAMEEYWSQPNPPPRSFPTLPSRCRDVRQM